MTNSPSIPHRLASAWSRAFVCGWLVLLALAPASLFAAFGLTSDPMFFTVDTGAGLVFKIRRVDLGSSTQSPGDIASLVYNGVEYQDQSRGSQVNSGFDWLYTTTSAVDVSAETIGTEFVKVTVKAGDLTHYYMARSGYPHIYMGTYFTTEPNVHGLVRYIVRIPSNLLPNGPVPSDIRNNTGAIEASDVFGMADGTTRSKHYSNMRMKDWSYIGATGTDVGMWMMRNNQEGGSGGPFYRSLLMQTGSDQEITYMVNYGEVQTEAFRLGVLNHYTLVATNGAPPPATVDTSWFANMNLLGYVGPAGRGRATGAAITGRDPAFRYTVGFANSTAQYWASASDTDGSFDCGDMLAGTYTVKVYKNELAVWTGSATVAAGNTTALGTIAITADPSTATPLWRIGDWDGAPTEFLNGDKVTTMHPSDVRMSSWVQPAFVIGTSTAATNFPAYQWKGVNTPLTVKFNLGANQLAAYTLRVGITIAYVNARPRVTMNAWTSTIPAISTQPSTRSLTVGSYRGNNTTYTFNIPVTAFVIGENTLTISAVSGSGATTGFLSAGYSLDAVDLLVQPPVMINATASGTYGSAFNYTLNASNAPTSFTANGLPPGLNLNAATGIISGTPAAVGTFAAAVSATNASGTANATLTLTIARAAAAVTLGNLTQSYDGSAKTVSVTTDPAGLNVVVTYNGASTPPTTVGSYAVVANVSETNYAGSASGTLNIVDTTPPVLTLPANLVLEATSGAGAVATFNASATDDVDGTVPVTLKPASGSTFPLGTTTVNASASDAAGNISTGSFSVTVRDTTAPVIESLAASKTQLWPADHSMVSVRLTAKTSDAVSAVTTRIVSVTSNEPINGLGDGDMAPDWQITGDMTLDLRAESSGMGNGRTYTITVEARDAAGNASTRTVTVFVPRNMS